MGDSQPIVCEFVFSLDVAVQAYRAHWRRIVRKPFQIILTVAGMANCVLAAILVCRGQLVGAAFWFVCALFLLGRGFLNRLSIARYFKKRPDKNQHVRFEFYEEEVRSSTAGATGTMEWRMFTEARKCDKGYLLYSGGRIFQWVALNGFKSEKDREAFEELLKRKIARFISL